MDIFELATRKKFRFSSPQGLLSVEQLWDLPLQARKTEANLDDIGMALRRQLKETEEESLVSTSKGADATLQPKLDIIKHIIAEKMEAREKADKAAERRQKRQRILQLVAEKEDAALASKSVNELRKLSAELEAEED